MDSSEPPALWIPTDVGVFQWLPMVAYRIPVHDPYVFIWIAIDCFFRHNAFQPSGCLGSRWRAGFSSQGLRVRRGVANWKFLHPAPGGRREGRGVGRVGEMYLNMLPCIWEGTLESFFSFIRRRSK